MTLDRRSLLLGASGLTSLKIMHVAKAESSEREKVLGIGGLFFRSRNPTTLATWYKEQLGIDPTPAEYNQRPWHQKAGPTVFTPFSADTEYFGATEQAWMVNFRVRNLDAMVKQLRASKIEVKVDPKKYPNGRFARLQDPEGNPIELWEPLL